VKGATKLQYHQFLQALLLISDKHQVGFCDIVGKILRHGINRRDPSIADFLVMCDPAGAYEDARDLERPRGLPKLHRSTAPAAQSAKALQAARSGMIILPSAGDALDPLETATNTPNCDEQISQTRTRWETSAAGFKPMAIGGTGHVDGNSQEASSQQQAAPAAVDTQLQSKQSTFAQHKSSRNVPVMHAACTHMQKPHCGTTLLCTNVAALCLAVRSAQTLCT
jgi:hypothetical protein